MLGTPAELETQPTAAKTIRLIFGQQEILHALRGKKL